MTSRLVTPFTFLLLAVVLKAIAHYSYGSANHQAFQTALSYSLLADALWLFGRAIYAGETWLPAIPAYLWLFRFFAVVTIAVGVWDTARKLGFALPVHF